MSAEGHWYQAGLDTRDAHWMREVRDSSGKSVCWCGRNPESEAHELARQIALMPDLIAAARRIGTAAPRARAELRDVLDRIDGKKT